MQSICSAAKIAEINGFIQLLQNRSQHQKNWWLRDGAAMSILVVTKKCPKCESVERYRIRRSLWMRLIPKSRYYLCDQCAGKFISVNGSFSFYWPFGQSAWADIRSRDPQFAIRNHLPSDLWPLALISMPCALCHIPHLTSQIRNDPPRTFLSALFLHAGWNHRSHLVISPSITKVEQGQKYLTYCF